MVDRSKGASSSKKPREPKLCSLCGKQKGIGIPKDVTPCDCLVKTVSATIVKPLDMRWEDGPEQRLFDLRGCMHRLLNAGVRECWQDEKLDPKTLKWTQSNADIASAARRGVKHALEYERSFWTSKIGKKFEGQNYDEDKPERLAELALPSVIEDQLATRAAKAYTDARKHMARGDKSIPSYNKNAPIFLRDGDNAWQIEKDAKGYVLSLKLYPGRSPMVRFALRVQGANAHADMNKMLSGKVKLGDCRVVRNERVHPKTWEVRLAYSFLRPERTTGDEVIAVHRGMHNFITIASTTAEVFSYPGTAYMEAKMAMKARRRSISEHIRKGELGHGARGHGTRRRYKALTTLQDAEARMIKSACQKVAAFHDDGSPGKGVGVVDVARRVGASVVLIEDYDTLKDERARTKGSTYIPSWPWAQLKGAISWACAKNGLELKEVPSAYISITCPACGNVDADNVKERVFVCQNSACGLERNVDAIAAFNMLRQECGDAALRRLESRLKQLSRACRDNKARKTKKAKAA